MKIENVLMRCSFSFYCFMQNNAPEIEGIWQLVVNEFYANNIPFVFMHCI